MAKRTMRAVVVREHGGFEKLRLEELPVPEPHAGEVRVRVHAAGVNHLDAWVRRGVPGHEFPLPLVPGSDCAGVIDAVGPGRSHKVEGDEVVLLPGVSCRLCEACLSGRDNLCEDYGILGESRDGCCADYVVVPFSNLARKPKNLSMAEAAAVPLVFQTAWSMLVTRAGLRPGETVLIQAAGSGVGSAAVQIARLLGAVVIATAGSDEKCERALQLGADRAINYGTQKFVDEVRALTDRRGVDVVIEHIGAATFAGSMRCLGRGGRLVTCGATTGGEVQISLPHLFFKNLSILGNTMGSKGDLLHVLKLVEQGRLRPVLDRTLPLAEVRQAHALIEQRATFGKVVLTL
jgi:NADPH:quinone reductase-like Zn-dependent oxidoreductase